MKKICIEFPAGAKGDLLISHFNKSKLSLEINNRTTTTGYTTLRKLEFSKNNNLLTDFDKETGIGVLLNTSFNVNGKPILSTYKDAFEIYDKTQLDCLLLEDYYIRKEAYK